MDDFIPKSPEIYKIFYCQQMEITDIFFRETQQQDPVLRQILFWK